jgi:hypothetical protein
MFPETAIDNRTAQKIRPSPPSQAFSGRRNDPTAPNDLLFRRDRLFCNIETKIRQYG